MHQSLFRLKLERGDLTLAGGSQFYFHQKDTFLAISIEAGNHSSHGHSRA